MSKYDLTSVELHSPTVLPTLAPSREVYGALLKDGISCEVLKASRADS
jgi:hypothetical protein